MDYLKLFESLSDWIRQYVRDSNCRGTVVGLSGGIDSAIVAAMCKRAFPGGMISIVLPCYSNPQDEQHAKLVARAFDIQTIRIDLSSVYDSAKEVLDWYIDGPTYKVVLGNIKSRLRMVSLYAIAGANHYMVVGTGNKIEKSLGYFTKYGDGGCDILPIANLLKCDVVGIAKCIGVPKEIIEKAPSAGLWENQTDEDEMGLKYDILDEYFSGNLNISNEDKTKIVDMIRKSEHKRRLPAIPNI